MDVKLNIIPATSLGGFNLRAKISEYSELIERYLILDKLIFKQVGVYTTCYSFLDVPLELFVDTRTGLIFKISALEGYQGKFCGQIKIGSSARDVLGLGNGFYYDECDEAILSKEIDGIAFELNDEDPLPEEVTSLDVEAITVFDPELFKP
jgi:hypothetical protein